MVMPEIDGVQLARIISSDPVLKGLPMILLTSSMHVEPTVLRSVGIREWLSKPPRSSDLYDGLVRLLGTHDLDVVAEDRGRDPQLPPIRPGDGSWWARTTR